MGLHKTEANIAIAKKENADILLEKTIKKITAVLIPILRKPVSSSHCTHAYLKNSAILASKVQNNLLKTQN